MTLKRFGRAGARRPVAGQDDGPRRAVQDRGCPPNLRRRRLVRSRNVEVERGQPGVGRRRLDVFWDRQIHRAGPLRLGQLECLANHLGDRFGRDHHAGPLGDRLEHGDEVDALVRLLVDAVQADLGGERKERRAVGRRVGDTEEQVDRPWPKRRRAHTGLAGETSVDLSHERGGLFVSYQDVTD